MPYSLQTIEDTATYKKFNVTIPEKEVHSYFERATATLSSQYNVKGFRPGKVPLSLGRKFFDQQKLLEEVLKEALKDTIPSILKGETFRVLGDPLLAFDAIAYGAPLTFTLTLGRYPEHISFRYKDVLIKATPVLVEDGEIAKTLEFLQRSHKAPAIDDYFAKTLGEFTNVEELKKSIYESLLIDKKTHAQEENRLALMNAIRDTAALELPEFIIAQEAKRRMSLLAQTLQAKGMKLEDYAKKTGRKEEEIEKTERELVTQMLQHALILQAIAQQEGITVLEKEVEEAFQKFLLNYRDAKQAQREIDIPATKRSLAIEILHEKVFTHVLDKNIKNGGE